MKPAKADRKKFDLDLAYGEVREDKIADMLQNKKIEVKSEPEAQEEFPWTSVVFGAAILWAIVCFTFFGE